MSDLDNFCREKVLRNKEELLELKSLGEKTNWEVEKERRDFLDQFISYLSDDWNGGLRNLLVNFQGKEVDRLLLDSINYMDENAHRAQLFIEFLGRSGYKDPQSRAIGDIEPRRTTALHLAARSRWFTREVAEIRELFKFYDKFDVNYTDEGGLTHFHVACEYGLADVVEKFLESRQNPNCIDEVTGDSPLHVALARNHKGVVQLLLRSDVDPNLANSKGSTSLHIICQKDVDDDLVEIFFQINDDEHRTLLVDAVDNKGRTPLHYALHNDRKRLTEWLLRRGANPNLADSEGQTPLHVACQAYDDDNLVEILFEICDELSQLVEVDARDEFGRTPLQSAVANFLPDTVDLLLNHGADLSNFVFPTESYFGENCEPPSNHNESEFNFKLRQASGALAVVENLEKRGYELERSDTLTVMEFFVKYELFEKSKNLNECRYDDNMLIRYTAKLIMIRRPSDENDPCLSLDDLIKLRPKEAEKLLSYREYFKFARSKQMCLLSEGLEKYFALHLCETMSRGLLRRWVLDSFMDLTLNQLPILCCEIILKKLKNQDLLYIFLAIKCQNF